MFVGADAYIGPADCTVLSVISGKFVTSQRVDVGIGPYMKSAFLHCITKTPLPCSIRGAGF